MSTKTEPKRHLSKQPGVPHLSIIGALEKSKRRNSCKRLDRGFEGLAGLGSLARQEGLESKGSGFGLRTPLRGLLA